MSHVATWGGYQCLRALNGPKVSLSSPSFPSFPLPPARQELTAALLSSFLLFFSFLLSSRLMRSSPPSGTATTAFEVGPSARVVELAFLLRDPARSREAAADVEAMAGDADMVRRDLSGRWAIRVRLAVWESSFKEVGLLKLNSGNGAVETPSRIFFVPGDRVCEKEGEKEPEAIGRNSLGSADRACTDDLAQKARW